MNVETGDNPRKVCIVGLDNAGKTTIIHFVKRGMYKSHSPTLGVNLETLVLNNLEILVMDLGGQVAFRENWSQYLPSAQLVVFVLDGSDVQRFKEADQAFQNVVKDMRADTPLFLVSNKRDVEYYQDVGTVKASFHSTHFITKTFETSAKTSAGLFELFDAIVEELTGSTLGRKNPYIGLVGQIKSSP